MMLTAELEKFSEKSKTSSAPAATESLASADTRQDVMQSHQTDTSHMTVT